MKRVHHIYTEVGDPYGFVELVQHMGSDQRIIDAARVSLAQDMHDHDDVDYVQWLIGELDGSNPSRWRPERDPKLLRYLIKHAHWSPLEHCTITWHVAVPLFVRGQWHRHRTWSYNEVSRRYTSDDLEFYLPREFRRQADSNKQGSDWSETFDPAIDQDMFGNDLTASDMLVDHVLASQHLYQQFLDAGIAREQARMVLPQNMYTRYYGTVNLRNALAFLKLRYDNHAQWEIFKAAPPMMEHLEALFPETLAAFREVTGL